MEEIPTVPGLYIQYGVISPQAEARIVAELDAPDEHGQTKWMSTLKRRVQHYGYYYDYKSRGVPAPAPPITGELLKIADVFRQCGEMDPEQVIVNEYTRKQGISAHVDSLLFGPTIISVSLLEPTIFYFTPNDPSLGRRQEIEVPARSIILMSEESRYDWKHEIPPLVNITVNGMRWTKPMDYRRISLTYRTLSDETRQRLMLSQ